MEKTNKDSILEVIDTIIEGIKVSEPPPEVKDIAIKSLELLYMMKNDPNYITAVLAVANRLCAEHPATGTMFTLALIRKL